MLALASLRLLVLVAAGPSTSPPAEARAELVADQALDAFERGDYEDARLGFSRAYALDPRPSWLYAMAQSERLLGHCDRALPLYARFLELGPSPEERVYAEANIEQCRSRLEDEGSEPRRAPARAPSPPAPAPPDSTPAPASSPPWSRDPAAIALLSGGLVGIATGTGLVLGARGRDRAAGDAQRESDYAPRIESAIAMERAGIGLLAVGAAAIAAAGIRYAVVARRRPGRVAVTAAGSSVSIRF